MRKVFTVVVLALAMMVLSLSLAVAQGGQQEVEEVLGQTVEIRGLTASPDVKVDYLSTPELRAKILQDFEEENPEEEVQDAQEIMVMLGFIEPDLDLLQLYIDLYTEQIAGFYDPEDDSLYLISEEKESMSAMDRYILAHELTHYLQDQNFDLMRPPFDDPDDAAEKTDDDALFAATCLVEGDAMITSDIWLGENLGATDLLELEFGDEDYSTEVFDGAPEYIQDALLFPYQEGRSFAEYIYEEGGFDALDKAYGNPPSTTEQIYHPEKYLKGEGAVEVDIEDLSGKLGVGWELDYDNVLGEFDVYELFKPYLSGRDTRRVAEGWGGNRYHYYRGGEGGKLLVQVYAWDSEKDAQEFAAAYMGYVQERFRREVGKESPIGAWTVWRTDDYRLALKRDGVKTYLVQATEGEPFQVAVGALGEEGDVIEEGTLEEETVEEEAEERKDFSWLVVGGVVGLLILGIILIAVMLVMYRRPPAPPAQSPAGPHGPYVYPPGGGTGGYGETGAGGSAAGMAGSGQVPLPPPKPPPPPPPPSAPPAPPGSASPGPGTTGQPPAVSE